MPHTASLFFHGAITRLLTFEADCRTGAVFFRFEYQPSIKDTIEALGPPHTEVIAITANKHAVGFDYLLQGNDTIDVYSFDTVPPVVTQKPFPNFPDGKPRFILDVHLGGLARYLRFAGFDTLYSTMDPGDQFITQISDKENRIVLSRDVGLLKRSLVTYGYWLRHTDSRKQFSETINRYSLQSTAEPFTRCTLCNGIIEYVEKHLLIEALPQRVYLQFDNFWRCQNCAQIYWKGMHYNKIKKTIDLLLGLDN